jgi:hypothetical protein
MTPAQIAEHTLPSVVLIRTPGGLGTGFVVRADGRVATNLHVIGDSREATVVLADKRELPVEAVVAVDPDHDLIVLHVAAKDLVPLRLGDSEHVKPGEPVVAIGHPLGLGNTVSNGLVSAVREVRPGLLLLQISAPISPGSSGGPLLNEQGEVIGLSTLVVTEGQNLNFGMPVSYLRPLLDKDGSTPLAEYNARAPVTGDIRRDVPTHPLSLLDGCSDDDLQHIREVIGQAIEGGAPLYNQGNHGACFKIYEGAALELQTPGKSCVGPRKALMDGVARARAASTDTARAWHMRDAFDGVLDVIERKLGGDDGGSSVSRGPQRQIPKHDLSILRGCTRDDLRVLAQGIASAIDIGAPLYNQGNIDACFRIYQGTVLDLIEKLQHCKGPRNALQAGIRRTRTTKNSNEKAWMLRDTFDGLIDVLNRSSQEH